MKKLRVTVNGKIFEVSVQILDEGKTPSAPAPTHHAPAASVSAPAHSAPVAHAAKGDVPSPLAGKVISIDVKEGQTVQANQQLLTLEAMKMNTYIHAPKAGKVEAVLVQPGQVVEEGQGLVRLA